MRLGQLARKLNIKPTQIISFLEKENGTELDENLNNKLSEDQINQVIKEFEVKEAEEITASIDESTTEIKNTDQTSELLKTTEKEKEDDDNEQTDVLINEDEKINIASETNETDQLDQNKLIVEDENGEFIELNVVDGVIKAPKKELTGPKVIGKIDLTPKRSVEFVLTQDEESTNISEDIFEKKKTITDQKKANQHKRRQEKKSRHQKTRKKKQLSDLELKEKQAELLVQKQLKQVALKKEQKKSYYDTHIKDQKTNQKNKKKKEKKQNSTNSTIKSVKQFEKEPTTLLGKIWKWFNT